MAKESFLRGAVILAAASTVNRLIGLIYMVVLPRLIHDEGMGLYQLVKPIHYFAAVIAIAGMPVAISKLIAEKTAQKSAAGIKQIFRLGLLIMACTGGLTAAVLVFGAPLLARMFARDPGVEATIAILGIACFFLALSAALRGFFQGLQNMLPAASSQVAAQILRVAATIFFCLLLKPGGIEQAVTGVAWGFVVGECAGWLILLVFYFNQRGRLGPERGLERRGVVIRRLLALAGPAVVTTVLWPIMQLADSLLIPLRMQCAGFRTDAIREGLGHLGMALALAHFPNIVTVALATSLIPAISEAWALGSKRLVRYRTEEALRMALIFGIPACAALFVLAEDLGRVLFGYSQVGVPLRILSLGTVTLGLVQSTTGVLQGLGAMFVPVRNLLFAVGVKFSLNYVLLGNPSLGILGAAWGTAAAWATAAVLDSLAVFRRVKTLVHWRRGALYPLVAASASAVLMYLLQDVLARCLPNAVSVFTALVSGFFFYFLLLIRWGSLQSRDLHLIPVVGKRLEYLLQGWGFLRS